MNSQPTVSVITRTKDRALLFERALQSVLGQTYQNWHHVIVNDGGNPHAVDKLIHTYAEQYRGRLTVIHHEESKGMEAASNAGVRESDGRYVVIHDDDDSWEPTFIQECIEAHESCKLPSVKGIITHTNQIFERIEKGRVIEERRQDFDSSLTAISLPQISEVNRFLPISFLFERSVFDMIGLFDEDLPVIGDWEFNIRYFMHFDVLVVKKNLANYHIRSVSQSNYENTVTAGSDDHALYRALIINKHIREDLAKGLVSKGTILAQGDYFYRTGGGIWRLVKIIDKLKDLAIVRLLRRLTRK